ncbi:MAG: hypothetical protein GY780_17750 [bacterium]|nr:hypothetical protein [bacterium]
MDRINGPSLNQAGMLDRFKVDQKNKESVEKSHSDHSHSTAATPPADRAEISDTAHQLMDLRAAVDVGRAAMDREPEVREDKIAQAKMRLEQGFYNSQEVQDIVNGALGKVLEKLDEI